MARVLRNGADGTTPRKATVMLTSAELRDTPTIPGVRWTGQESDREIKAKLKKQKLLAKQKQPPSRAHVVQGGLPELGRRR